MGILLEYLHIVY